MPALARLGLLLLSLGLFADLAYHARPALTAPLFGADGSRAHLVVFVGMLVVVCGLIEQGLALAHTRSLAERGNEVDACW